MSLSRILQDDLIYEILSVVEEIPKVFSVKWNLCKRARKVVQEGR